MCDGIVIIKILLDQVNDTLMKYETETKELKPFERMSQNLKMVACGPKYIVGLMKKEILLSKRKRSRRGLSGSGSVTAREVGKY